MIYIRLAHLGENWSTASDEAQSLLPVGYGYVWAGNDGAWAECLTC